MNAVSLQSAVFNGASILGPALAGLTLSRIGYSGNFFLNAASFFAVLVALLLLRAPTAQGKHKPVEDYWTPCARHSNTYGGMPCCLRWYRPTQRCCFSARRRRWCFPLFAQASPARRSGATRRCCSRRSEPVRSSGALIVASLGDIRPTRTARVRVDSALDGSARRVRLER